MFAFWIKDFVQSLSEHHKSAWYYNTLPPITSKNGILKVQYSLIVKDK